jgi:hypothetical protein
LWHDEIFTVWASRLAPSELLRALRSDSGPPLFYFLEKPFVAAAEALALSDAAARLLPFLALAVLFAGARSLPPGGARRRFAWLAASAPLFLLYSAEARAYALLAVLSFLLFLLVVRESGRGFVVIALAAALCLWTHYLALFVLAALLFAALREGRGRSALALGAGAALFLPWSPILWSQPAAALSWMREPAGAAPLGFLAVLGGGARVPGPFGPPLPEPLLWLAGAAGLALLAGVFAVRPGDAAERIGLTAVLLTLGGILLVSVWRPVAFSGRSEMAVLPIWIWIVARAAERSRALRAIAGAAAGIGAVACVLICAAPRPSRSADAAIPALETAARRSASIFRPGSRATGAALPGSFTRFPPTRRTTPDGFSPGRLPRPTTGGWATTSRAPARLPRCSCSSTALTRASASSGCSRAGVPSGRWRARRTGCSWPRSPLTPGSAPSSAAPDYSGFRAIARRDMPVLGGLLSSRRRSGRRSLKA